MKEIVLEITKKCQNKCIFCSSNASFAGKHLAFHDLASLILEAKAIGIKTVAFSGGEPFLHPDINLLLTEMIDNQFDRFAIYTSGNVDQADLSNYTLDRLRESGIELIFNVQSTDKEIHERLTNIPGSYDIVMENMDRAIEFGVHVECHIVPNRLNLDSLFTTGQGLLARGVSRVSFLRFVAQGRAAGTDLAIKDIDKLRDIFGKLSESSPEKYRFGIPFSGIVGRAKPCVAGIDKVVLRYDGVFVPCEALKDTDEFILGRLGETSLMKVCNNAKSNDKLSALRGNLHGDVCPADRFWGVCK